MAQTKKIKKRVVPDMFDGMYLLKMALCVIAGSLWLKFQTSSSVQIGLPIGFMVAIFLASRDRSRTDRKIEYAVLFIALLVGYFAPYGFYLSL